MSYCSRSRTWLCLLTFLVSPIDFTVLLDLMASQPRSFAIAVLAELGNDGPRPLASALMVSSLRLYSEIQRHLLEFPKNCMTLLNRLSVKLTKVHSKRHIALICIISLNLGSQG